MLEGIFDAGKEEKDIRDSFMNASKRQVANASMATIDALQHYPKGVQVAAIFVVFKLLVDKFEMTYSDALAAVNNIMGDSSHGGTRVEFKAIKEYLRSQLG